MPELKQIEALFGAPVTIQPVFQPVFDTRGNIQFHELLLRPRVDGKPMSPFGFVTRIEQAGPQLTMELDRYMLNVAFRKLGEDQQLKLSANVSMNSVCQPEWATTVGDLLERHPDCARRLGFEVTESGKLTNLRQVLHFCETVHQHGSQVLLDDAGTGVYATSIGRFRGMHANVVKIAKEVVDGLMKSDSKQAAVFHALMKEAARLGVPALAEGIETGAMLMRVKSAGVELFQGYLLDRPHQWISRVMHPPLPFTGYRVHPRVRGHVPGLAAAHHQIAPAVN